MYYGAADTVVGLARARIPAVLDFVKEQDYLSKIGRDKRHDDVTRPAIRHNVKQSKI